MLFDNEQSHHTMNNVRAALFLMLAFELDDDSQNKEPMSAVSP